MAASSDLEVRLGLDPRAAPAEPGSVSQTLLRRFRGWMGARRCSAAEWPVVEALRLKADHLDGRLGCWRRDDLAGILTELFPRKVTADESCVAQVVPALRLFLGWLDEAGLLDPDSDPVSVLHAELERVEPELPGLMADESRHGLGKAFATAMLADGVDLDDPDAVRAWTDALNARQRARAPRWPTLPPVSLPDDHTLAELAAGAPLMRRLRTVVDWVGDGRALIASGDLRPGDADALAGLLDAGGDAPQPASRSAEVVAWGLVTRLLTVEDRRLLPGPDAAALDDAPLDAWRQVLLALVAYGEAPRDAPADAGDPAEVAAETSSDTAASLLVSLQLRGPMTTEDLTQRIGRDLGVGAAGREAPDELTEAIAALLEPLAELRVVEVTAGTVRLAALGRWFARTLLEGAGARVPVVTDLSAADASALLAACTGREGDDADAAVDGWIAERGAAAAAEQLADLAAGTTDSGLRARAFAALERVGAAAEPAVRRLRAEPACRQRAAGWLVARGLEEPRPLDAAGAPAALGAQVASLAAQVGPEQAFERFSAAVPAGAQPRVLEGLWRNPGVDVVAFLEVAAGRAGGSAAKAARKALFRWRTAAVTGTGRRIAT